MPCNTFVEYKMWNGTTETSAASALDWDRIGGSEGMIAYRVLKAPEPKQRIGLFLHENGHVVLAQEDTPRFCQLNGYGGRGGKLQTSFLRWLEV